MIRFLIAVMALGATVAAAQTTRPSPLVSPTARPSREELDQLHAQAIELMRAGKNDKAGELLDRIYKAVPAAQRSRAFVLNRAILDLIQKRFVMRGVRDLADYLSKNRGEDELATNVLGACLNLAADNAHVKASVPWQAAFKEWDRRNYLLDHGHPGWRRWGTRWETEDEHKAREAKKDELRRAIDEQGLYVNRLVDDADSLMQQQQNAANAYNAYAQARAYLSNARTYLQQNPSAAMGGTFQQPIIQPGQEGQGNVLTPQTGENQLFQNQIDASLSAQSIGVELAGLFRKLNTEQLALQKLQKQLRGIRPDWPSSFEPVDPNALSPAPTTLPTATPSPAAPVTLLPPLPIATTNPAVVPVAPRIKGPLLPRDLYDQPGER